MATKNIAARNPGMVLVVSYFVTLAVSAVVLYFANMYFPNVFVLGTMSMDSTWALLHSMGKLALLLTLAIPFLHEVEHWKGSELSPLHWMVAYFFLNFGFLWVITRFSDQYGLGVSSWMALAGLALVLDFVQGAAMMAVQKFWVEAK